VIDRLLPAVHRQLVIAILSAVGLALSLIGPGYTDKTGQGEAVAR
jgi:hypothetical protein